MLSSYGILAGSSRCVFPSALTGLKWFTHQKSEDEKVVEKIDVGKADDSGILGPLKSKSGEGAAAAGITAFQILRRLGGFVWPKGDWVQKTTVASSVALMIAGRAVSVAIPFVFRSTVDHLNAGKNATKLVIGYGAVKAVSSLFREAQFSLFAGVTHSAVRKVAIRVVEHLHELDLQFHLDRQTGGLTRVIDRGTKAMSLFFGSIVFNVVPAIMELGMVVGALSHKVGWKLALSAVSALSAYSVFTLFLTQWRVRLRQEMNALENKAGAQTVDSLMNYVAVKAFSAEDREILRYDDVMHKYQTASIRFQMSLAALNFGQNLIFAIATVGMIGLAAHGIHSGKHTVGDAVLVNGLLNQIHRPLNFLGVVYREVKQASVDMENMFSLLDKESRVKDLPDALPFKLPAIPSTGLPLLIDSVSFSYNADRSILKGVSFHADPGDFIAVVGGNGSGKTTLIRLLSGFLAPENGKIWMGGQDLRKITLKSIRPHISLVPQDTTLFNHSIRQNIMVGNPSASEEEFQRVVESIGLDKSVSEMPDGWETMVGERGLKLSEGEKQKISIARALLKKSRVLFCDEATSFLDVESEKLVMNALRASGSTLLVVAHRLSTIRDAKEIIVLKEGEIVERGTHAELIAMNGLYTEMWQKQQVSTNQ